MLWTWVCLMGPLTLSVVATVPEDFVSQFNVTVPHGPVTAPLGSSVILPCAVTPSFSVVPFIVQWHRPNKQQTNILLYEDQKIQEASADPQYRGRASLVGDLEKGDASLKLENLTLADRGGYVCLVNGFIWVDKAQLDLSLTVVGSIPVISKTDVVTGQVNVTCVSDGWSPQPKLTWRHRQGDEISSVPGQTYSTGAAGLVSVRSWLLVSPSKSEWISCSVHLSDEEMRESRLLPQNTRPQTVTPDTTGLWKGAFISGFILLLLAISALLYLHHKGYITVSMKPEANTEVETPKATDEDSRTMSAGNEQTLQTAEMETNTENPDMVDTKTMTDNPIMQIPDFHYCKREDTYKAEPKNHKTASKGRLCEIEFTYVTSEDKCSLHQQYWERSFEWTDFQFWCTGVCSATAERKPDVPLSLTPENGFWLLCFQKGRGHYANTEPPTHMEFRSPRTLGMFLDCDKHTLSFYDAEAKTHLCTFNNIPPNKTFIPLLGHLDSESG